MGIVNENEILYLKRFPKSFENEALVANYTIAILEMKELELLFHKVLKKKKKICSTEEFEIVMKKTLNNKKVNKYVLYDLNEENGMSGYDRFISNENDIFNTDLLEEKMIEAILGTTFKKRIIKEIEKEFKIRLANGRLKNFKRMHGNAMDYNGYDILIEYLRIYKMYAILVDAHKHCFESIFINCNDEPYDIDDINTPISYTDMSAFM